MNFHGMNVILNSALTENGERVTVERTWRERLFSWPWRPLQKTRSFTPQIPYRGGMVINGGRTVIMHPETFKQVKELFEREQEALHEKFK
jgi:hypothetical protein